MVALGQNPGHLLCGGPQGALGAALEVDVGVVVLGAGAWLLGVVQEGGGWCAWIAEVPCFVECWWWCGDVTFSVLFWLFDVCGVSWLFVVSECFVRH